MLFIRTFVAEQTLLPIKIDDVKILVVLFVLFCCCGYIATLTGYTTSPNVALMHFPPASYTGTSCVFFVLFVSCSARRSDSLCRIAYVLL